MGTFETIETPNQKTPEITRETLKNLQTLEVEIMTNFDEVLEQLRLETGADLQSRSDGYHLTIIGPTESGILKKVDDDAIAKLQEINEKIQRGEGVVVNGVGFIDGVSGQCEMREADKIKKTAFISIDIPDLQEFRAEIGLQPKDFHIMVGFVGGDIHMRVMRREPVKPGSSKMKEITEPIPKRANSHFDAIVLPEIDYGGLKV